MRSWFITGASKGLGLEFARAALSRGDRVAAAARTTGGLGELAAEHGDRLLVLPLDVTDRAAVRAAVDRAAATVGLDIVVNNAGIASYGFLEEFTEEQARAQLETNFFGALWVSQAVLPHLRERGAGHIVQISSIGGLVGHAVVGMYAAGKWALEGMSEALAMEAAPFGVDVTIVEPGGYWTELYTSMLATEPMPQYADQRAALEKAFAENSVDSDPGLAADALLALVDSDDPPLRLLLGNLAYDMAFDISRQRMDVWSRWEAVSRAAEHGIPGPVS
jgi:NAD(P)-dependent dehydrogenase (short-subunit alcohol dehydrogenase family)